MDEAKLYLMLLKGLKKGRRATSQGKDLQGCGDQKAKTESKVIFQFLLVRENSELKEVEKLEGGSQQEFGSVRACGRLDFRSRLR